MSEANFKMNFSRLMNHLGEELITNEFIALSELVKNSYDAGASKVEIVIKAGNDIAKKDEIIEIFDNGSGMNEDDIRNKFLNIATKSKDFLNKERSFLGNKGIGRLGIQKLGKRVEVITKEKNSNSFIFEIDWEELLNSNKDIKEFKIHIREDSDLNINFIPFGKSGTILRITRLKNSEFWSDDNWKNNIEEQKNLNLFENPFKEKNKKFEISLDLNGKNNSLIQKVDIDWVEKNADTQVIFQFNEESKILNVEVKRRKDYVDSYYKKLEKNLKSYGKFEILKKDLYYDSKESIEIDFNDSLQNVVNKTQIKNTRIIEKKQNLKLNKNHSKPNDYFLPGSFSGKIFAFSSKKTEIKDKALNIVSGVKIFRNDFVVKPYGDNDNDWLGFYSYAQSIKNNIFKAKNTLGYVYIDGEKNKKYLVELTNREGLIKNNYSLNFLEIMKQIVAKFASLSDVIFRSEFALTKEILNAKDEKYLRNGVVKFTPRKISKNDFATIIERELIFFNQEVKKTFNETTEKQVISILEKNFKEIKEKALLAQTEIDKEIKKIRQDFKNETEKQIIFYKDLVGQSIVTHSLSHEISSTFINMKRNLNKINEKLKTYLEKYNNPTKDTKEIILNLETVYGNISFLQNYIDTLEENSYWQNKKKIFVDIKQFIISVIKDFPQKKLKINVVGNSFSKEIITFNFRIALQNIIINSDYWTKGYENPNLTINLNKEKKEIRIYDNGPGISKRVENNLFDPFVTAKPIDSGRGLGLNIAKELLKEINFEIILDKNHKNLEGNFFTFIIKEKF